MLTLKRYEIHRLEEGMHKYMLSVSYHSLLTGDCTCP